VLSNGNCNIRKRIISYSSENATQKIWEVQGIPCLHTIGRLSDRSLCPACLPVAKTPALEKRKRQLKKKPSTAFHSGKYKENFNISGATPISFPAAGYANDG